VTKFKAHNRRAAKLSGEQVLEIFHLYHEEGWSQGRLSREFEVGAAQIGKIVRREAWQEVLRGKTLGESELRTEGLREQGRDRDLLEELVRISKGIARPQSPTTIEPPEGGESPPDFGPKCPIPYPTKG
jgi:transposase-like protein